MKFSERVYRILLTLYPRRFLRDYRDPLQQAFRDQLRDADTRSKRIRLWLRIVPDIVRTAPAAHLDGNISALAAYPFCIAAMFLLGRFELRTDDTGVEVASLLLTTSILGCLHPRRAWIWGFAGLCIPAADIFWRAGHLSSSNLTGFAALAAFTMAVSLAGSYGGVAVRRRLMAIRRQ